MNVKETTAVAGHEGQETMTTRDANWGGKRPRAGRTSQLGPSTRRDLRVSVEAERAAIKVGAGVFSDGMRYMVDQYLRTAPQRTATDAPPEDEPVLIPQPTEERWAIVVAVQTEDGVKFRDVRKPHTIYTSETWRRLPNPDDPIL